MMHQNLETLLEIQDLKTQRRELAEAGEREMQEQVFGLSVDDAHHVTITANFIHDNGVDTSHDHGIYFKTTRLPVRYLLYIAITALARVLIELVSAEHKTGTDLMVVAGAILIVAVAVLILQFASHQFPSAESASDLRAAAADD